ncbi:hypothetical protein [Lactobacillus kitasatonis]|uniref:hypothetical protein n=1 Tax=Lactobacillus kitasatonis TaxID=237446 RepID=UPI003F6766B3
MNEQFLSNTIAEDASQMIKAYMMQNAQLKAIVEQQKQQIQQLQAENKKLNKTDNKDNKPSYLLHGDKVDTARSEIIRPDGKRISMAAVMAGEYPPKEVSEKHEKNEEKVESKKDAK